MIESGWYVVNEEFESLGCCIIKKGNSIFIDYYDGDLFHKQFEHNYIIIKGQIIYIYKSDIKEIIKNSTKLTDDELMIKDIIE